MPVRMPGGGHVICDVCTRPVDDEEAHWLDRSPVHPDCCPWCAAEATA